MSHLAVPDRSAWRHRRRQLEEALWRQSVRSTPAGERRHDQRLDRLFGMVTQQAFRLSGLYARAHRNAHDLRLVEAEFRFPDLPPAFDGYRILHLSDLHVGCVPGQIAAWTRMLAGVPADLVVITGDVQSHGKPVAWEAGRQVHPLLAALVPPDGVVAVLGNHDEAALVEVLEGMGVTVLVNQSHTLTRGDDRLHLVGTDDVHCFYTPAATQALAACRDGFRIALVHSPELADEAEAAGYALYLAGHTHAGQVALPGGRPLITMLDRHRRLAHGAWRHGRLQGYTSAGSGGGDPPLRLNTRPEAALIRLVRG